MRSPDGSGEVDLTIDFRDQEMWTTPLQTTTKTFTLGGDWAEYTMCAVAPTNTANPVYHSRLTFTAGANAIIDIDEVKMEVPLTSDQCYCEPEICDDLLDNDCDGDIDLADLDCIDDPLKPKGEPCELDSECASNKCKGKSGSMTCR